MEKMGLKIGQIKKLQKLIGQLPGDDPAAAPVEPQPQPQQQQQQQPSRGVPPPLLPRPSTGKLTIPAVFAAAEQGPATNADPVLPSSSKKPVEAAVADKPARAASPAPAPAPAAPVAAFESSSSSSSTTTRSSAAATDDELPAYPDDDDNDDDPRPPMDEKVDLSLAAMAVPVSSSSGSSSSVTSRSSTPTSSLQRPTMAAATSLPPPISGIGSLRMAVTPMSPLPPPIAGRQRLSSFFADSGASSSSLSPGPTRLARPATGYFTPPPSSGGAGLQSRSAFIVETAAVLALSVFQHPFSEEAALAVLGSASNEVTLAVLRSLLHHGFVVKHPTSQLLTVSSTAPTGGELAPAAAVERFCVYFIEMLKRSVEHYWTKNVRAALAVIDANRAHIDLLLLEMALPIHVLPKLVDALLLGSELMVVRWKDTQIDQCMDRVAKAIETPEGRALPQHDVVLAWALREINHDKSMEVKHCIKRIDETTNCFIFLQVLAAMPQNLRSGQIVSSLVWAVHGHKLLQTSKLPKAIESFEHSLQIREAILGKEHPAAAIMHNSIGTVYSKQGEHARALASYRQALLIEEQVLGAEHPDTAATYANIGNLYYLQRDYEASLKFFTTALDVVESVLGPEHQNTAVLYNNMGGVHDLRSEYHKALGCYGKAVVIFEGALGENHPGTATSYAKIGGVYDQLGDRQHALEFYSKALSIRRHVLGDLHAMTGTSFWHLAGTYRAMGNNQAAIEHMRLAHAAYLKSFGPNHKLTNDTYTALAKWSL